MPSITKFEFGVMKILKIITLNLSFSFVCTIDGRDL